MREEIFKGFNGRELKINVYDKVNNVKGIFVIVHGMQEHMGRYSDFCKFLESNGFVCYIMDLRGHGKNITKNFPGHDDGDIYLNIVEDYKILIRKLNKDYAQKDIILFGHSFGSFITQRLICECDNIVDKFILCGTSFAGCIDMRAGNVVAKITKLFKGENANAKLVEKLMFGAYKKKFASENGNWLSRDSAVWENYAKDEFCGQPFPTSFYCSFFKNAPQNYKHLSVVDESTPILIIGGSLDPVGHNGKTAKKLYKLYLKHWLNVSLKLYEGARHELLNETNKEEVMADILKFLLESNKVAVNRK